MRRMIVQGGLIGLVIIILGSVAWAQEEKESSSARSSTKLDLAEERFSLEPEEDRLRLYFEAHVSFVKPEESHINVEAKVNFSHPGQWLPDSHNSWRRSSTRKGVNTFHQKIPVASLEMLRNWDNQEDLGAVADLFEKEQVLTLELSLKSLVKSSSDSSIETRQYRFSPLGFLLRETAKRGAARHVELIISKGGDVNDPDARGITPLMIAAGRGQADIVRILLDNGANVQVKSTGSHFIRSANGSRLPAGSTPLHAACYAGRSDIVMMLLAKEAEGNAKSADGWTPVTAAAFAGTPRGLQLLLQAGGDVNGVIESGYSAAALALINGNAASYRVLKSRGGKVTVPWKKDGI